MQIHPRIQFFALTLVALALAAYWIDRHWLDNPHLPALQMPPATVCVVKTKLADLPIDLEYPGRTAGSKEVEIYARATGILQERTYKEGGYVHQGDILFKIEPTQLESLLIQAQANLMQTERNWKRSELLYDQDALSSSQYEEALASVESARAQLQSAQSNFSYTDVAAPLDGMSSQENLSEGSLVLAGQTLLTRITKLDPLYVYFDYPDKDYTQLRKDLLNGKLALPKDQKLTVTLKLDDGTAMANSGVVDFTDSFIDTQTSSVHARATIANPGGVFLAGQFVRVNIQGLVQTAAIAVPEQAIVQSPQGIFVYIVDSQGLAQVRPVTLGPTIGTQRVIASGLYADETVIFEGMVKVRAGAPVTIVASKAQEPPVLKP